MTSLLILGLSFGNIFVQPAQKTSTELIVGQPVDIASSAYQFRVDRKPDRNQPESWIALMHYAQLPLNKPVDQNNAAVKSCLASLLWEEIRPVQTLELTWPAGAKHLPSPSDLKISALMNQGGSSSWWNNLAPVAQAAKPTVSKDGRTVTYSLGLNTCGLVIAVADNRGAANFDVPQIRVLAPDTWKSMDIELEWGFDKSTKGKDYSGRIQTYDGRMSHLRSLAAKGKTTIAASNDSWRSTGPEPSRRGVAMNLLYMGTSKWRKQQQYTTQADDVARTIVTVWTNSGNFSFLAADLENGPIYAPEYGFFVQRTSPVQSKNSSNTTLQSPTTLMATPMNSIAGNSQLKGWGSDATPWFGSNPTSEPVSALGITFPPKCVAMHPGQNLDVVAEWQSAYRGKVSLSGSLTHAQAGSNGVDWFVTQDSRNGRRLIAQGTTNGTGTYPISIPSIEIQSYDKLALVVGAKGAYQCDTTIIDWTITEIGGNHLKVNLARDVATSLTDGNPHSDGTGFLGSNWSFGFRQPMPNPGLVSSPPIELSSNAITAHEYVALLAKRNLKTIRQQTRNHAEQTWEGAVFATRGGSLPPHPAPPAGTEPVMQVDVPSDRLNAQWKLGAWHLLRHCAKNPQTGKLWFNDFPYGILAAETYLVLSVLDQMGSHEAAADGFDQWLSMPLEREHPVGLFTNGQGAFTNAIGPEGYGGNMDTIHAFGPGSIGWALAQHYQMTGDTKWPKANEARLLANAEWMLRQRQVLSNSVPNGAQLWGKGLQPALQVTPDSGGLWMQFYECEAYYLASVTNLAAAIAEIDPAGAKKLQTEAENYRLDLKAAVERSIALSPVVPVRDGTFHSVIPFACYVRGLSTGAWGWQREGSGSHVGPLYWDTVQSAAALISPTALLAPSDVRVQGYLDVLEDRVLLENQNVGDRDWFQAGWQYQGGLERTANMHLAADDVPVFLRSFLNCYAVDILPNDGYTFNEHAVHGPPDKIFEEAAFLERFRNLLVMEEGQNLWLDRAAPREWMEQGKKISVRNAPSKFGVVAYEIVSDVDRHKISANISLPSRKPAREVLLRIRHPKSSRIKVVTVNGKPWSDFDPTREIVKLHGLTGKVTIETRY